MPENEIRVAQRREEFAAVERVLADTPAIDPFFSIPTEEFIERQQRTYAALKQRGLEIGLVFSDEHYNGDVPYLGGNTNVQIEQVAGVIGRAGFQIIAGLEGGYVAEQLAERARAKVAKVELFKLAGEDYPIEAARIENVLEEVAGGRVHQIGLLTPREIVPVALVTYLEGLIGRENIIDCQDLYQRIKYEKSDNEVRLIRDASIVGDAMVRAMLASLKPGMLETQVAAWGYFVARELGAEEMGWDVMVGANTANRTLIGRSLNRIIHEGDYVHLGVAPKRDGLNSCVRRSCVAVKHPREVTDDQRYWFQFIEDAYQVGLKAFAETAANDFPAGYVEKSLVEFYRSKSPEVSARVGYPVAVDRLKPYSSVHNTGYTECQEFFGAVNVNSAELLGHQVVLMLDVAVRGIGDAWNDVIIPGMDYLVVENTCGKSGRRLDEFNLLPTHVQDLVGIGVAN
jgi:Xaa-Pro aminopeptidase